MGIGFLDRWRARRHPAADGGVRSGGAGSIGAGGAAGGGGEVPAGEAERSMAELFGECGLLRELADSAGVTLDDSEGSLTALDQLLPRWRDDPEVSEWLGNDAGLYLGTVIHRNVRGARWRLGEDGSPLVVLRTGLEIDVTALGHTWADQGTPQLAAAYLATADG